MAPSPDRDVASYIEAQARLLVRRLIVGGPSTSTSVDLLSPNYERRVDYVLNSFNRHRFLDVNRHSVWRSINGLSRKLLVHSQERRSTDLKALCERFVRSDVFGNGRERRQSMPVDIEYSVLALLVHLADRPTGIIEFTKHEAGVDQKVEADDVDQKNDLFRKSLLAELVQGDEEEKSQSSSSDDLSDWSDAEDFQQCSNREFELVDPLRGQPPTDASDCRTVICRKSWENEVGGNHESRAWLSRNLSRVYWTDSVGALGQSRHHSSLSRDAILRSQWEACIDRRCVLRAIRESIELTERQIIREILWLLQGRKQLFVFEHCNGAWIVREGIAVSHLTQLCLRRVLDLAASCGNTLATLRNFVEQMMSSHCEFTVFPICRTYEAYANALSTLLVEFERLLCRLERTCAEQSVTLTILSLLDHLRPWFAKLIVANKIHKAAVLYCPSEATALVMAVRMQTELYSALILSASEGGGSAESRRTVAFLLTLFTETIRPYLEMIDSWVTLGIVRDDYAEFLLSKNEEVVTSDESFWDKTVVVRSRGPPFLGSTLDDLIVAGKSTQLLRRLDRLGVKNQSEKEAAEEQRPLHELFVERLRQALHHLSSKCDKSHGTEKIMPKKLDEQQQSVVRVSSDPLWKRILATNFRERTDCSLSNSFLHDENYGDDTEIVQSCPSGRHLDDLICESLSMLIRSRCGANCAKLIEILDKEFGLGEHLLSIRKFYLMEAGDIMFHFYSQLFDKIPANEILNEEVHIKMILEDVLTCYAVPEANRLSVDLDRKAADASNTADFIHLYDSIRLSYKVPWPLNLVISTPMWGKYNRVFSFLLRVKCTKYALDELRFVDLDGRPDLTTVAGLLSRVHGTRVKLLHFVNGFHGFLMTRLLYDRLGHHRSLTAAVRNGSSRSLQDVMDEQRELLELIEERCFLRRRTAAVLSALTSVFNSALAFHAFWKGTNVIGGEKILADVDKDLRNCGPFLITVLRKSASSSPHFLPQLESLVWTHCGAKNMVAAKRF